MGDGQNPKRRLGRGLDALIGGFGQSEPGGNAAEATGPGKDPALAGNLKASKNAHLIKVDIIKRNPFQPRSDFDEPSLDELAKSIAIHGVLQPILIRQIAGDDYQLIAGERRLLAAQRAGLKQVPCRVLKMEDRQASEAALEENLKRRDLNALEKAQAFQDYVNRFGCTIGELARRLSIDRSSVSNMLRMLDLPESVRTLLTQEKISAGHAKAILPLEEAAQLAVCARVQAENLSVRLTEQAVRELLKGDQPDVIPLAQAPSRTSARPARTAHLDVLEKQLQGILGLKVRIRQKDRQSGNVVIEFGSDSDFENLMRRLQKAA
ncbi:MAG: ParB/RepB/Spo0J family partition protein [Planctomycetaceae bacterium]